MTFDAHVVKVMIATPGDTADEVVAVKDALHGWNGSRAENAQAILLPRFWKTDAVPVLSPAGGQGVINSQLVDDADILLVLFDSRLGRETDSAVSGTAEEIERASAGGKPVHVWFSDEPIDRPSFNPQEYERLLNFRKEMESKGLLGVYSDLNDLSYKVRDAIESDVSVLGFGNPSVRQPAILDHAVPVFRFDRESNDRLIVKNESRTVRAEMFEVSFGDLGDAVIRIHDEPFDLNPLAEMSWTLALDLQSPPRVVIEMKWLEDGAERSLNQPVTLFG